MMQLHDIWCRLSPTVMIAAAIPAQQHLRWVEDLGNPERSEAAERALVDYDQQAIRPLQELIVAWDTSSSREIARMRATLRVIGLLVETALPLADTLMSTLESGAGPVHLEACRVRASMAPWSPEREGHMTFHHLMSAGGDDARLQALTTFARCHARVAVKDVDDAQAMRAELDRDELYRREVAAETLARLGDASALDLLRTRLTDRARRPKGWDQLRNGGFVVPVDDERPRTRRSNSCAAASRARQEVPRSLRPCRDCPNRALVVGATRTRPGHRRTGLSRLVLDPITTRLYDRHCEEMASTS